MYSIDDIKNSIIKGDCIEGLKKIPDGSVDLIFADPPYYMQTEGELKRAEGTKFAGVEDEWDKFSSFSEYDQFCFRWLKECQRVLKKDGSIWVIGSFQNIYRVGYIMQELGFWILNDMIWSKPNPVPNFTGSRFTNAHETMLWCSRDRKGKPTFNYKTMKHLNGDKQDRSVWNIGICIGNERIKGEDGKKAHSTQKPSELLRKVILSSSRVGDTVLDPFMGSGTTAFVAKTLGRNFIGFEREDKYIKVANKRLQDVIVEDSDVVNSVFDEKVPPVPMQTLLLNKYLSVGETLFNKKGEEQVVIKDNGHVDDGEEILSIHKMSGKKLGKANHNGWDYWFLKRGESLLSIDELRVAYRKEIL